MSYIELTTVKGKKFLANANRADRFLDKLDEDAEGNVYISGLTNNGGIHVLETYKDIKKLLFGAGVLIISKDGGVYDGK